MRKLSRVQVRLYPWRVTLETSPFTPVPVHERHHPARRRTINGIELYLDRFVEHREAAAFLDQMMRSGTSGSDTIVRALLHYRDAESRVPVRLEKEAQSLSKPEAKRAPVWRAGKAAVGQGQQSLPV
jgi:hypothetical protein